MPRRKALIASLIGLLSLLAIDAATTEAKPSRAAAGQKTARPLFMWEVQSKTASVHLLGSVHVANQALYPLDPRIEKAFAAADTLVLETPMDAESMQKGALSMQAAAPYTPPDSLEKHADAATIARLRKALAELGLPAALSSVVRPWMLSITLTLAKLGTLGYSPELGIDLHFHKRAVAAGKTIGALESIDSQVALLTQLSEQDEGSMLAQTLDELDEIEATMRQAFVAWGKGDAAAIHALMVAPGAKEFPRLHKRMFVDRNVKMAERIDGYLKGRGKVFVVVGAGHLVGPDSILVHLKKRGHASRQR